MSLAEQWIDRFGFKDRMYWHNEDGFHIMSELSDAVNYGDIDASFVIAEVTVDGVVQDAPSFIFTDDDSMILDLGDYWEVVDGSWENGGLVVWKVE